MSMLIVLILLTPNISGFRTFTGCGDGTDYSELKTGVDNTQDYLDDEWNWQTGGSSEAQGHGKDKSLTREDAIKNIWGKSQSQIFIYIGHGAKNSGALALYGDDHLYASDFNNDLTEGNWQNGVAGSIFLFASCESGINNAGTGVARNARDAGARFAVGEDGSYKLKFATEWGKQFAKYCVHDSKYTVKQINDKAFDKAYDNLWWLWLPGVDKPKSHYYYWVEDQDGDWDVLNHKPRKDYDYDYTGISIPQGGTKTVGGGAGPSADNGGMLFFNSDVLINNAQIKVEYKRSSSDPWQYKGTYALTKDTSMSGVDLNSEDIIIWFYDDQVWAGYLEVRITAIDSGVSIHNFRVHIFGD